MSEVLRETPTPGVVLLRINRPEARNALSMQVRRKLSEEFLRINDDDPASPTFGQVIGRYQSRPEVGIHNIEVVGDKAYIAYYQDGLRVLDLSDPTQPREIAHYNTWDEATAPGDAFEGALGVRVANGLIYVADDLQGLVILRELP